MQVVSVGPGPRELCPATSLATLRGASLRYHSDPSNASFSWLADLGIRCEPVPDEGVPAGSVVAVPAACDSRPLYDLVALVDRLLGPGGCPWDREQTHETLKRHLLEEAYEVLDAIDSGDSERLAEELGDLLLQPIMHAQMQRLDGSFDIDEVARRIVAKLIRRHPHVFGEESARDADEVLANWDKIKRLEKGGEPKSILAGVPTGMASLLRAYEVSKRAARVGFEWPAIEAVFDKLKEEILELKEAISAGEADRIEDELGDLLFTVVNISRWTGVEPEEALRRMLNRFTARFIGMERMAEKELRELTGQEWDELWERSKAIEIGR